MWLKCKRVWPAQHNFTAEAIQEVVSGISDMLIFWLHNTTLTKFSGENPDAIMLQFILHYKTF